VSGDGSNFMRLDSKDREEILDLMVKAPTMTKYVTVEWCGEIDPKVAVVI
jgi:hypothetical protein